MAATNIEDSAAARCQRSAVSTQLSVQRSASKISRNFFAKCKEVTEEKLNNKQVHTPRGSENDGNDSGRISKQRFGQVINVTDKDISGIEIGRRSQ